MDGKEPTIARFLHDLADLLEADDEDGRSSGPPEPPPLPSPEAEEAARRLAREVAAAGASRARASSDLVSRLAHEIRTPLSSMLMTTELLAQQADAERSARLVERLGVATREIRTVLEDTVELVKIRSGRREPAEAIPIDAEDLLELIEEAGLRASGRPPRSLEAPLPELRLALESLARAAKLRGGEALPTLEVAEDEPGVWSLPLREVSRDWLVPFAKSAPRGIGLQLARARAALRSFGGDLAVHRDDDAQVAELRIVLPAGPSP